MISRNRMGARIANANGAEAQQQSRHWHDSAGASVGTLVATASPTQCAHANRVTVTMDRFDIDADAIVADVAALYAGSDLENNQPRTAAGCMAGPTDSDCGPVFAALGLPFGDAPAGSQRFFTVKAGAARTAQVP